MTACDHIAKVLNWGVEVNGTEAILKPSKWGCVECDETWDESPSESFSVASRGILEHDSQCGCFGCKARTLRVAYSGVGGGDATAQKKWDRNLAAYKRARELGVQPAGTKPAQVQAAFRQSEKTGTAFKAF